MVVPRSALKLASDDEYSLYAVTTFQKHAGEFVSRAREQKWVVREWEKKESGEEREELERVGKEERRVWGECVRLGGTAWGEAGAAWVHVVALRAFVETVLRYGLPLRFVCGLVKVCRGFFFSVPMRSFFGGEVGWVLMGALL